MSVSQSLYRNSAHLHSLALRAIRFCSEQSQVDSARYTFLRCTSYGEVRALLEFRLVKSPTSANAAAHRPRKMSFMQPTSAYTWGECHWPALMIPVYKKRLRRRGRGAVFCASILSPERAAHILSNCAKATCSKQFREIVHSASKILRGISVCWLPCSQKVSASENSKNKCTAPAKTRFSVSWLPDPPEKTSLNCASKI
jgi:hypothetical protein